MRGIYVGAEDRMQYPSADRDGRIYRLAVPVLKKKKMVISRGSRARTAKECTNKRDAHAELLFS